MSQECLLFSQKQLYIENIEVARPPHFQKCDNQLSQSLYVPKHLELASQPLDGFRPIGCLAVQQSVVLLC